MGNAIYSEGKVTCFDTIETCAAHCGKHECIFVNKCSGNAELNYVCFPIDTRLMAWLIFGSFLIVIVVCSSVVACYACRAIKHSFQHAIGTDGDIVFYGARNVVNLPHPAASKYGHYREPPRPESEREFNLRRNGYF
uniref:Uncharacterized protein n=1 Tax=Panagrolaimus sp. JU765 TaxID=591449 RepID=A0AC34QDX8_9BILA